MYFSSISYRQKNRYLLGACLLMTALTYLLAIRRTLDIRKSVGKMEAVAGNENEMRSLHAKLTALGNRWNGADDQGEFLLENVSNLCQQKKLRLHSFPNPEWASVSGLKVATYKFEVEGEYRNLLELLFGLERLPGSGKVVSAAFAVSGKQYHQEPRLGLTVFWQNIQQR